MAAPIPVVIFGCGLMSPITTAIRTAATGLQAVTEIPVTMGSREGTTSALTTRRHPATSIRFPSPRAWRCSALRCWGSRCSGRCRQQGDKNLRERLRDFLLRLSKGGRTPGKGPADPRPFVFERDLSDRRTDQIRYPHGDHRHIISTYGSLLAAAPRLLLRLIGPVDDCATMWSNAPRSVGAMGAANRTVVTITVMMVAITVVVRICLVDSHSPIGADTSGSIDAIDTGGCVARVSEHERAKCDHDGEHRCAISDDAQHSVLHIGHLGLQNCE